MGTLDPMVAAVLAALANCVLAALAHGVLGNLPLALAVLAPGVLGVLPHVPAALAFGVLPQLVEDVVLDQDFWLAVEVVDCLVPVPRLVP